MIFSENRYPPSGQARGQAFTGSCSGRLVVAHETIRRLRPPDVEGILRRVIAVLPGLVDRDVIDVGGIFGIAAPRIAPVVEIIRPEYMPAETPAAGKAFVGHLQRTKPDIVDAAHIPAAV